MSRDETAPSTGVMDFYKSLCVHNRIAMSRAEGDLSSVARAAGRWPEGSTKWFAVVELIKARKRERDEMKEQFRQAPVCMACRV